MSDVALSNAEARLDRAAKRIAEIEAKIAPLRAELASAVAERDRTHEFIIQWHDMAGVPLAGVAAANLETEPRTARPKNPDRREVALAASNIIQRIGRPMSRAELFQALKNDGFNIQGKDPEMVLSTMLWREKEIIVRLPPHGYWPANLPNKAARYDPLFDILNGVAASSPEDDVEAPEADD